MLVAGWAAVECWPAGRRGVMERERKLSSKCQEGSEEIYQAYSCQYVTNTARGSTTRYIFRTAINISPWKFPGLRDILVRRMGYCGLQAISVSSY